MKNPWKVIAIICIVLLIAETTLIVWAYQYGQNALDNKVKCSNEICFNVKSDAFTYEDYTRTCSCYVNNEVIHQEVMP